VQSNGLLWFPLILSLSKDAAVAGAWFDKLTMSGRTDFAQALPSGGAAFYQPLWMLYTDSNLL